MDNYLITWFYAENKDDESFYPSVGENTSSPEYQKVYWHYNVEKYRKINNKQIFHKLNWRKEYHEIANGKLTIYGYIKQNLE